MDEQAGLRFLPSSTPEGFASKAVSSDNDANPSVIVRELIQNSLDAGTPPGSRVEVDFVFEDMAVSAIPGIDEYRSAFEAARKTHSHAPDAAEAQIERITDSLNNTQIPVLQVLDNGVGLDARRTNALLSDGLTNKVGADAKSAGSYGLGHYTAFPASDLQYILYGGVTQDRRRTMSGHAILASHFNDETELLGKDGYFIAGSPRNDILNRYRFPEDGNIPPALGVILDDIERRHGRGSAVMLLAFNSFRDESDPADSVLRVASRHFYPVIRSGNLVVRTHRAGEVRELDDSMAADLLRLGKGERRSRSDAINGSKAYAMWRTLQYGNPKNIETDFGKVKLHVRPADADEGTRISLFRSGMFITDAVPMNQGFNFAEYRRFNSVILISTPNEDEDATAFDLIRQAEGEKHASIDRKRLPKEKRMQFDRLLRAIREALQGMATKDDADTHVPDGFMELEMTADAERINPRRTAKDAQAHPSSPREFTQVPEHVEPVPDGPRKPKQPGPEPKERISRSTGRRVRVSAAARRNGRTVHMVVKATEDIANATLRLSTDQGADATCTNPLADKPMNIRIVGEEGSFLQEMAIGQLQEGQRFEFDVDLQHPVPAEAVLKVDVLSRKAPAPDGEGL